MIGAHGQEVEGRSILGVVGSGWSGLACSASRGNLTPGSGVTAGHKSVTVTVVGGLAGTPLSFANLRSYRSGVAVAAVRSNWPSAGKIRIYLTRTVSSATSVAWMVMD